MKAFGCLAAPSSHPFWTSDELPWPLEQLPPIKALPDPGHIMVQVRSPAAHAHAYLLSSGQSPHYAMRHGPAKYSKFAYSSAFGFSCSTGDMDLGQLAADSMLALFDAKIPSDVDGETWRVRRIPIDPTIEGRGTDRVHLRSKWRPWQDVEVETWLVPPPPGSDSMFYLRVHKITSGRALKASDAGWSVFGQGHDGRALIQSFSGETSRGGDEHPGWSRACTSGGCVGVLDLPMHGSKTLRKGKLIQTDPNSNVIVSRSILPSLEADVPAGETWLATAVFGFPATQDGAVDGYEAEWAKVPEIPSWLGQ